MLLKKEFTFDAAHRLERYRGKCEALHGHTYRLAVTLKGHRDDDDMVFDFTELKKGGHGESIGQAGPRLPQRRYGPTDG